MSALVEAYLRIRERVKEQKRVLADLRKEEGALAKELQDYLNQTDEIGLRVDENTVITLTHNDKKINRTSKSYKSYLTDLCSQRGLPEDEFVRAILAGKVEAVVQQPRLKIIKI